MGLDTETARQTEMSRRKQTNPQSTKRTNDMSDGAVDEDQLNDNQKNELESDDQLNESNNSESNSSVKKKRSKRSSLSPVRRDEIGDEEESDKLNNQSNKSKRNKKSSLKMCDREEDELVDQNDNVEQDRSINEDEPIDDRKQQDAMRALFSRLQGFDSEPADLLSACNKKKKKIGQRSSPKSSNSRSPISMEASNDNESENDKNNVNNPAVQHEQQNSKRTKRIIKDEDECSEPEDMQCDNEEEADDKSTLNQSWSSSSSNKKSSSKIKSNDLLNGLLSNDSLASSNKKRKLNQNSNKQLNPLVNQLNAGTGKDLSASEMLAKYQSQFAQLSQQLLLNNQTGNSALNDSLMNSFIAAAVNNSNASLSNTSSSNLTPPLSANTLAPCPSPKSINTSSSLDKLTSIVDSIDKINVNQPKTSSSNLSAGNSTPGLSDSDNGSNLLLQLPTLSSLNKQSKTSPNIYGNSTGSTFQDVFNNMKLLPQQLLELQQTQQNSTNQLFQPAPIKSPSTSSTHSSHSSSSSPNFFAKLTSNANNSANTLSSLASTLSGLTGLNSSLTNQLTSGGGSNKQSNSKSKHSTGINKSSSAKSPLSANQSIKMNQQQQLNNLLRQHAALQLFQQQQTEQDEMFDDLDKEEEEEDEEFDLNSQLLKQLKKQMQKSKNDDQPQLGVLGSTPLDLSCKKDDNAQSALNALIASKLLESGGLAGLNQLNQLNQLNNLTGLSSLFGGNGGNSPLNNNLNINNLAQLNQLNSILSANNLLNNNNSNSNQNKLGGRFDLLTSLLGASSQPATNQLAGINPLLGLNLNTSQLQQQQQQQFSKKKESSGSYKNNLNSSNNSNPLSSSANSLSSQLVSPNSSNFWNLSSTSKIKPYSASSSLHIPNPKAMQLRERSSSGQGRANPWQTQWMNRSSEQNRDVFTCVYCRLTFNSLDEMTQHMKISPRCGMAGMQQANAVSAASTHSTSSSTTNNSSTTTSLIDRPSMNTAPSQHHSSSTSSLSKSKLTSSSAMSTPSALIGLSKEKDKSGNQVPRKLVRGQDVWLGRGAEQTRQILKCIWCQESFKTLDDLSKHMHVTQHFMNIISPEQITSWKQPDEKTQQSQMNQVLTCKVCDESFPSLKELSAHIQKTSHYKDNNLLSTGKVDKLDKDRQSPSGLSTTSSTSTTGGLSVDHQLSNGNQQKKRNSSNGSSNNNNQTASNNSGGKEKRKKSLPVRKLLELERNVPVGSNGQQASLDSAAANSLSKSLLESMNRLFGGSSGDKLRNGYNVDALSTHSSNEESENSLHINNGSNQQQSTITCDECKESMDLNQFIIHLKHCKPSQMTGPNAQLMNLIMAAAAQHQEDSSLTVAEDIKSPINDLEENDEEIDHKLNGSMNKDNLKLKEKMQSSPERSESRQSIHSNASSSHSNRGTPQLNGQSPKSTIGKQQDEEKKSGSVLNALEQLIEKSFDSKKKTSNQGILQKLGIDEEACLPPWQMNLANANSPASTGSTNNAMFPNAGGFSWSP